MKKLLFSLVTILMMVASGCSNEQAPDMPKEQNVAAIKGKVRSADEAIAIAMAAKKRYSSEKSRASLTVKDVKCYGAQASRSGVGADSLYYIVNFNDEQGYAIIGANRRASDVLVVSDEGFFDINDIETGTPREMMYHLLQNYALSQSLEENNEQPSGVILDPTPMQYLEFFCDTMEIHTERMLNTRWKQSGIYAKYAESLYDFSPVIPYRMLIGCTPLAMGMVMSYYKYPQSLRITFDGTNRIIQPNWSAMLRYDTVDDPYNQNEDSEREEAKEHIALVLREIAKQAGSFHDEEKTDYSITTWEFMIEPTMKYFGFDCEEIIKPNDGPVPLPSKDKNNIILTNVYDSEIERGHTIVFDGYSKLFIRKGERVFEQRGSLFVFIEERNVVTSENYLVHVNWGWGGKDNGFYDASMFLTSSYRNLDTNSTGTNSPYTYDGFEYFTYFSITK